MGGVGSQVEGQRRLTRPRLPGRGGRLRYSHLLANGQGAVGPSGERKHP
jgi:hypothetical protein